MERIHHGYVFLIDSEDLHRKNPTWRPGWGASREAAKRNARYPRALIKGGSGRSTSVTYTKAWVWERIEPEFPWPELRQHLEDLPEELRRLGRFRFHQGGEYDVIALLCPHVRHSNEHNGEWGFEAEPPWVRAIIADDVQHLGLLPSHLLYLEQTCEVMEGSASERFEQLLELVKKKEREMV